MLVRICIHSLAAGTAVHLMFSLATKYSTINLSSTRFCGARLRFLIALERWRHNTGRAVYIYIAVSQQSSGDSQDLLPLYPCDCLPSEFHSPPMGLGERLASNARGVVLPILGTMLQCPVPIFQASATKTKKQRGFLGQYTLHMLNCLIYMKLHLSLDLCVI